jgi:hypothetical protein
LGGGCATKKKRPPLWGLTILKPIDQSMINGSGF